MLPMGLGYVEEGNPDYVSYAPKTKEAKGSLMLIGKGGDEITGQTLVTHCGQHIVYYSINLGSGLLLNTR